VIMLADGEVHLEGTLETFEKSNDPLIVSFFK
jgi:ABC-type transporter Mla maintaining outer membrane lipid asymmetry ATPase subunit MlaF